VGAYSFLRPTGLFGDPLYTKLKLGLDLVGGTHVVLEAQDTPETPVTPEAMTKALGIIRFRVDKLGVSEPVIQRQGERRIIVELAGVKDPEEAVRLIGKTALLEFQDEEGNTIITGADLERADARLEPGDTGINEPVVKLELEPDARKRFAEATKENVGRPIVILLDDEVVQAPIVQDREEVRRKGIEEPIITGYESMEEAQRVALLLNSGALPVPMKVIENRVISATLGKDSIEKSKLAGLIGAGAVVLFMLAFYRVPGFVADFALLVYVLLVFGLLVLIDLMPRVNVVLTLPGIAGLLLSVGMAVDANVIIFERVKEEIRTGKTIRSAVEAGFVRAFRTIFDSNVTTLIGAGVLMYFGAGSVQGFAVTLSIGIVASMFTAIVVTRFVLRQALQVGMIRINAFGALRAGGRG